MIFPMTARLGFIYRRVLTSSHASCSYSTAGGSSFFFFFFFLYPHSCILCARVYALRQRSTRPPHQIAFSLYTGNLSFVTPILVDLFSRQGSLVCRSRSNCMQGCTLKHDFPPSHLGLVIGRKKRVTPLRRRSFKSHDTAGKQGFLYLFRKGFFYSSPPISLFNLTFLS